MRTAVLILAALCLPAIAMGRTPRADTPLDTGAVAVPAPHWSVNGELSFTDMAGNKSLSMLATGFGLRRLGGRALELTLATSARYGKSNGQLAVAVYTAELGTRFLPREDVSPFLRSTVTRDAVRNINLRLALAAGADLNLVHDGDRRVSVGVALLEDYEAVALPPDSTGDPTRTSTRLNFQVQGAAPIRPGVTVDHSSQLQPVVGDLGDYLLTSRTSIRVLLTRALAFQTSYAFNRDTSPPPGVAFRNDRTLTTGLVVELK